MLFDKILNYTEALLMNIINDNIFDFRFGNKESKIERLEHFFMAFTNKNLQDILSCARKLEIPECETRPSVDVLYDIAERLSIIEAEIISPTSIMERIEAYLNSN